MDDAVLAEDVVFTPDQHRIWETLYKDRLPRVMKHACKDYIEGFKLLNLSETRIPSIDELNEQITPRTGWHCVRTSVRYTDAVPWSVLITRTRTADPGSASTNSSSAAPFSVCCPP